MQKIVYLFLFFSVSVLQQLNASVVVSYASNPPLEDSVVDYIRVLHDSAGNVTGSLVIYKAKEVEAKDEESTQHVGGTNRGAFPGSTNGAEESALQQTPGKDQRAYLDSIGGKIYIYPNPATTSHITIQWDGDIHYLLQSFTVYPIFSAGYILEQVNPPAHSQKVRVSLRGASWGIYIVDCALTNGMSVKKKLLVR